MKKLSNHFRLLAVISRQFILAIGCLVLISNAHAALSLNSEDALSKVSNLSTAETDTRSQYSVDMNYLVYINENGELISRSLQDEQESNLSVSSGRKVRAFDISADSQWVAYIDNRSDVYRVSLNNEQATPQLLYRSSLSDENADQYISGKEGLYFRIEISPDDGYVVFTEKELERLYNGDFYVNYVLGSIYSVPSSGNGDASKMSLRNGRFYSWQYTPSTNEFDISPDGKYVFTIEYIRTTDGNYSREYNRVVVSALDGSTTNTLSYGNTADNDLIFIGQLGALNKYEFSDNGKKVIIHFESGDPGVSMVTVVYNLDDITEPGIVQYQMDYFDIGLVESFEVIQDDTPEDQENYRQKYGIGKGSTVKQDHAFVDNGQAVIVQTTPAETLLGTDLGNNELGVAENMMRAAMIIGEGGSSRFLFPLSISRFGCGSTSYISDYTDRDYGLINVPFCETRFGDYIVRDQRSDMVFVAKSEGDNPRLFYTDLTKAEDNAIELAELAQQSIQSNIVSVYRADYAVVAFDMEFTSTGHVVYVDQEEIYIAALDGSGSKKLGSATAYRLLDNDSKVLLQMDEQTIVLYDPVADEMIVEVVSDAEAIEFDRVVYADSALKIETETELYQITLSDEEESLSVANRQWTMVSVSGVPAEGASLSSVMSDEALPMDRYGRSWIMYGVNPSNGAYIRLNSNSTVESGKGYWLYQLTGSDVDYGAHGEGATIVTDNTNCGSSAGCVEVEVPTMASFMLVGQPLMKSVAWSDVRIEVDGQRVCTPAQAADMSIMADVLWSYTNGSYQIAQSTTGAELSPYVGYWVNVLSSGLGHDIKLLIPAGAVDAEAPTCQ